MLFRFVTFRIFTAITFFQHHDVAIQPNHRPPASKQHNSNRIKAECPESNRRLECDSVSFPLAYIPHNPDSRVSKVFIVLCLPLSDFHGNVDSFIRRCYQSVELTNEYAGNCIRFSTSRFRSNLFLLRTYSQRKEDMKRKRKQKLLISKPYKVHHALQDYSITFCKKSCPHI